MQAAVKPRTSAMEANIRIRGRDMGRTWLRHMRRARTATEHMLPDGCCSNSCWLRPLGATSLHRLGLWTLMHAHPCWNNGRSINGGINRTVAPAGVNSPVLIVFVIGRVGNLHKKGVRKLVGWAHTGPRLLWMTHGPLIASCLCMAPPLGTGHQSRP